MKRTVSFLLTLALLLTLAACAAAPTAPVSISMMNAAAGAEYAIKWINGEVPKEGIDMGVLKQIMEDYAGVECFLNAYEEDGTTLENFLLMRMDFLTYGEEHIK